MEKKLHEAGVIERKNINPTPVQFHHVTTMMMMVRALELDFISLLISSSPNLSTVFSFPPIFNFTTPCIQQTGAPHQLRLKTKCCSFELFPFQNLSKKGGFHSVLSQSLTFITLGWPFLVFNHYFPHQCSWGWKTLSFLQLSKNGNNI